MNYEIILKPNRASMMRYIIVFIILLAIGILCEVISRMYWDDYVTYHTNWRGRQRPSGWPYTLRIFADWMCLIGGVGGVFMLITIMRKKSSFGLNKEGLMINLLGWNEAFIPFKDINSFQLGDNGRSAEIIFHSIKDVIQQHGGKQAAHLERLHIDKKKPIIVGPQTAKGDVDTFISKLVSYHKQATGN